MLSLCCAAALLFSAGCGEKTAADSGVSAYTVTDEAGHQLHFSEKPKRIVSVTYGTDEILLDLVDTGRIAALSRYAGDEDLTFVTKEQKEKVGHTVPIDPEAIMAVHPDLVIVSTAVPANVASSLSSAGVPVYTSIIARNWDQMETKIRGIAAAVGEKEKGEAVVKTMEDKRDSIEKRLAAVPEDQEKTVLSVYRGGVLGRKDMLFNDVLRLAKVKNGADQYTIPEGARTTLSLEIIPEIDPDIMLLPIWDMHGNQVYNGMAEEIRGNPAFQNVRAVRNNMLVPFPEKYKYVMSQHLPDAIEAVDEIAYPDLFPKKENAS